MCSVTLRPDSTHVNIALLKVTVQPDLYSSCISPSIEDSQPEPPFSYNVFLNICKHGCWMVYNVIVLLTRLGNSTCSSRLLRAPSRLKLYHRRKVSKRATDCSLPQRSEPVGGLCRFRSRSFLCCLCSTV